MSYRSKLDTEQLEYTHTHTLSLRSHTRKRTLLYILLARGRCHGSQKVRKKLGGVLWTFGAFIFRSCLYKHTCLTWTVCHILERNGGNSLYIKDCPITASHMPPISVSECLVIVTRDGIGKYHYVTSFLIQY